VLFVPFFYTCGLKGIPSSYSFASPSSLPQHIKLCFLLLGRPPALTYPVPSHSFTMTSFFFIGQDTSPQAFFFFPMRFFPLSFWETPLRVGMTGTFFLMVDLDCWGLRFSFFRSIIPSFFSTACSGLLPSLVRVCLPHVAFEAGLVETKLFS